MSLSHSTNSSGGGVRVLSSPVQPSVPAVSPVHEPLYASSAATLSAAPQSSPAKQRGQGAAPSSPSSSQALLTPGGPGNHVTPGAVTPGAPVADPQQAQQPPTQQEQQSAASSSSSASATRAAKRGRKVQPRASNPLRRLTSNLLRTYNVINKRYYARKRQKKLNQPNNGHDDKNFDYIIKPSEKLNDRYVVDEVIGKGSFGRVVRAYDTKRDEYVAIKIVKSKRAFRKQARVELQILQKLQEGDPRDEHGIVRMKDSFVHHKHQCIVFELMSYNLYELLRNTEFYGVSLNLIRKFAKQLLKTLLYTAQHQGGIIHCDLKPENILLRNSRHSAIKVIDFGSACLASDKMYTYIQSRFYRAPEVLLGCPYDVAIDMWSLGCILVEMHTGKPIFDGSNAHEQIFLQSAILGQPPTWMLEAGTKVHKYFSQDPERGYGLKRGPSVNLHKVRARQQPLEQIIGVHTHGPNGKRENEKVGHTVRDYFNFCDLVRRMLAYDPKKRIKPQDAMRHPFFTISRDNSMQTESHSHPHSHPHSAHAAAAAASESRQPGDDDDEEEDDDDDATDAAAPSGGAAAAAAAAVAGEGDVPYEESTYRSQGQQT